MRGTILVLLAHRSVSKSNKSRLLGYDLKRALFFSLLGAPTNHTPNTSEKIHRRRSPADVPAIGGGIVPENPRGGGPRNGCILGGSACRGTEKPASAKTASVTTTTLRSDKHSQSEISEKRIRLVSDAPKRTPSPLVCDESKGAQEGEWRVTACRNASRRVCGS